MESDQFWGDLERRRPTKRKTTVRSFSVVKTWSQKNNDKSKKSPRKSNQQQSSEPTEISSRIRSGVSSSVSSEPISIHDVVAMTTDYNDDDISPLKTPVRSGSVLETSLPGAASVTPLKKLKHKTTQALDTSKKNDDEEKENENRIDDYDVIPLQERTPQQFVPTPKTGLQSGPRPNGVTKSRQTRPAKEYKRTAAVVTFKPPTCEPDIDYEQYEAHNLVRLFNADRGRKRSGNEVTDLDIILTNIEEIALEIKNETDSPVCRKVIRELFIQLRQLFSNSIDVYKEKKYLQSANNKANTKIRKMKQELVRVQAKRKRMEAKRVKLQHDYDELEKQKKVLLGNSKRNVLPGAYKKYERVQHPKIYLVSLKAQDKSKMECFQRRNKEEAYTFINELEDLQERLRSNELARTEQSETEVDLSSLLSEASGYLSINRQVNNINDKLQSWLDQNKQ